VRTLNRKVASLLGLAAFLLSSIVSISPANATDWVSGLSWSNLHVKTEDGVFERFKREFDNSSVLQTQSESQHNQAWVRTDRNNFTVEYRGGALNANKQVKFVLDGDVPFTDSIDGDDNIAITDNTGYASVVMTVTGTPQEEDVLRASISDGTNTVGTMVILYQRAGFYPVIKLVGTGSGPEGVCSTTNVNVANRIYPHQCLDSDLTEETWNWSVFKKDWLPEYSQVYVKSYKAGSTINLLYHVTDIWGTPIANKPIQIQLDAKCRICKWGTFKGTKNTTASGYVSFSIPNKNTVKEVAANAFVNADTKARERGFIAFAILPTSNELDESIDHFWPQIVTDLNIKPAASTLTTFTRGEYAADVSGNVVVGSGAEMQINPPQVVDELGTSAADTQTVTLNITYLKNSIPNVLYAPDVRVVASNGGRIGLVTPTRQPDYYLDASKMKTSVTFGYTYPQKFVFACTRPGTTVFAIYMGTTKKTYEMDCVLPEGAARHVVPVANNQIGIPGTATAVKFLVSDRFGNGIAGIPVDINVDGTITRKTSDSKGVVAIVANSSTVGAKTITATAIPDGLTTQFADAANPAFGILAGNTTATSTVKWGEVAIAITAGKGSAKLNLLNAKSKLVYVTEGKSKQSFKPTTGNFTKVLKLAKGKHTLVVKVGAVTKTLTITVL
jgi:hypothetical protein